jgi:RimJ/RimL family protein N-acetyltransferase
MSLKLVDSLSEVMQVRALRNSCSKFLTNYTEQIGVLRQFLWYFRFYRRAQRSGAYRIYLWCKDGGVPVGYGALSLKAESLLVTECVDPRHRGAGYGRMILDSLTAIAHAEARELVAEIWATNTVSVSMHENAGFRLESTSMKEGKELRKYVLPPVETINPMDHSSSSRSREVA